MLITMSLPRLPAALTSLLLMIQPIGSMILGAIIFGESPSVLQLLGVLVVLGAVVFATRRISGRDPANALEAAG
jgi:drug/metabolite transporter (DMT)-like permease